MTLSLIFLFTLILTGPSLADSLKERMKNRLPQITALKAQGVIGENNRGFLESRGSTNAAAQNIMEADNQDRAAVYDAIARQQNTNAANVGRRRAAQIAEIAPAGTWLQNDQGQWYRK
ncbi:MAG: YdbL family protein [Deltaproteobacteria bacterium]|nr:YdbL family protein [Deltaproteobacteria bacterium]